MVENKILIQAKSKKKYMKEYYQKNKAKTKEKPNKCPLDRTKARDVTQKNLTKTLVLKSAVAEGYATAFII